MKLLLRDTSSYRFMMLGGLFSRKQLPNCSNVSIPASLDKSAYRHASRSFGPDEKNVERFLIKLLATELGWTKVEKKHDILAQNGADRLVIECKRHDSRLLFIDEHKGGTSNETAVQELQRNMKVFDSKWGILTDGVTFRLYANIEDNPALSECFIEIALGDIMDSNEKLPLELSFLIDILSPGSRVRQLDPREQQALSDADSKKILAVIKQHGKKSLFTVMKALAVAALEDMGVRPLHTGLKGIRTSEDMASFKKVFESIPSDDPDFNRPKDYISEDLCRSIYHLFKKLEHVDFSNVDHEFFGIVYQRLINNGNASHYTNSKLSKEMAEYVACRNQKSQKVSRRVLSLSEKDYLLDPALGSGQLLRGLLPFHKVFFAGKTSGIDGWRALAQRFIGRDIDEDAIWVAKVNIWVSTAKKGGSLVNLKNFKKLDVISATINRRAGETIREALEIPLDQNIVACVSNPPWDAFKNDSRRGVQFEKKIVDKIKTSLSIEARQLNRAQIFLKIIHKLGEEFSGMRFSLILPDSIFVDKNSGIRREIRGSIDFYFSYPRNVNPVSNERVFPDVDKTRKFGIIFGRSTTRFDQIMCYPFGKGDGIAVDEIVTKFGDEMVFPLFSDAVQASVYRKWKSSVTRHPSWQDGEFHQSLWHKRSGRSESSNGDFLVIGGAAFCENDHAWSDAPDRNRYWKKMASIHADDKALRAKDRVIFSDYINNSKKLNSATFLPATRAMNVTNNVLYSTGCVRTDALIYDSPIFSTFVEVYGTSQHMNSWRMTALGLPPPVSSTDGLNASAELAASIGLTIEECKRIYALNKKWLELEVSEKKWIEAVSNQIASLKKNKVALARVKKLQTAIADKKRKKASVGRR